MAGGTLQSDWVGKGTITLSQPYTDFDAILVISTGDDNTASIKTNIIFKWELDLLYDLAISGLKSGINIFSEARYWVITPESLKTTTWDPNTENSGIQAIYGITIPD